MLTRFDTMLHTICPETPLVVNKIYLYRTYDRRIFPSRLERERELLPPLGLSWPGICPHLAKLSQCVTVSVSFSSPYQDLHLYICSNLTSAQPTIMRMCLLIWIMIPSE
jgi:hypothetical protein